MFHNMIVTIHTNKWTRKFTGFTMTNYGFTKEVDVSFEEALGGS